MVRCLYRALLHVLLLLTSIILHACASRGELPAAAAQPELQILPETQLAGGSAQGFALKVFADAGLTICELRVTGAAGLKACYMPGWSSHSPLNS